MLREYQEVAVEAAMGRLHKSTRPIVIAHATGSGKSYVVAELAAKLHEISRGKRVLCIQPSQELTRQNIVKYRATGSDASIFSASAGEKCLKHPVVFGMPASVINSIHRFTDALTAVIIDEAHVITPTIKRIINQLQSRNPQLRVVGLTATPYRMGTGYIYGENAAGEVLPNDIAKAPYFAKCVHEIGARELIARGLLTPPVIGETGQGYDTSGLELTRRHQWDRFGVDRAFRGHGRLTAHIVAEVLEQCRDRKGVMFFASTVAHAEEILASLPPDLSRIVTGNTGKKERPKILEMFLAKDIKYLVNVGVLTTGFDAAHVDCIALLRATESAGLLQQIVGRSLRVDDCKANALILDYAGNLERHCPGGDIFDPIIEARESKIAGRAPITCPKCGAKNLFGVRQLEHGQTPTNDGYVEKKGRRVMNEYGNPATSHYGRRCFGENSMGRRCDHRWVGKACPECKSDNDITARRCENCKAELIDPNKKLAMDRDALRKAAEKDRLKHITEAVLHMTAHSFTSKAGNKCIQVTCKTPSRSVDFYFVNDPDKQWLYIEYRKFQIARADGIKTVKYRRQAKGRYFKLLEFNSAEGVQ